MNRPELCRRCGRDDRLVSWRGYCHACGIARTTEAIEQMAARSGPVFELYADGLRRYVDRLERPPGP